jgi:hypothetical protein
MEAAMTNAKFYQGHLFVTKGYELLVYSVDGNKLTYEDYFSFCEHIEDTAVKPEGLIITTPHKWFILSGGPGINTYFLNFIADRGPGKILTSNGIQLEGSHS